jgi:single-strand DNA-binding protein
MQLLKFTQAGKPVANFSLAVNESFKSRDAEKTDHVGWFNCWGKLGEIAGQYVTKGKQLFVEGRLQTRKYDDREGKARANSFQTKWRGFLLMAVRS